MDQVQQDKILARLIKRRGEVDILTEYYYGHPDFTVWLTSLRSLEERLEPAHAHIVRSFSFTPNRVRFPGETMQDPEFIVCYREGLQKAKGQLGVIIEELEDFGPASFQSPASRGHAGATVNLNFVLSQSQVTAIRQDSGLGQESNQTQALIQELLEQLKEPHKDIPAIQKILLLLVDTATPVLIKILLAHFGLNPR